MHLRLEIACVTTCFEYAQNPLQIYYKFAATAQRYEGQDARCPYGHLEFEVRSLRATHFHSGLRPETPANSSLLFSIKLRNVWNRQS